MSYLKKPSLLEQQQKLQELIDERLRNEELHICQRVYQWLNDNQYFTDNELFDFYFCVAQNIAAVEVLGASGERILRAKTELEQSAEAYSIKIRDISEEVNQKLEYQLNSVQKCQEKLELKFNQMLEGLTIENQNLKTISTGLVNSTATLLEKQKILLLETKTAKRLAFQSVMVAWIIPVISLLGFLAITLFSGSS